MRAKPLGAGGRAQPLGLSTLALRGPQLQAGGASAKLCFAKAGPLGPAFPSGVGRAGERSQMFRQGAER